MIMRTQRSLGGSVVFFMLLAGTIARPDAGRAVEFGTGLAAVEEGDDRMRPAIVLHAGWAKGYFSRAFAYGRDFGPVKERSYLFDVARQAPFLQNFPATRVAVGLTVLYETTEISYTGATGENVATRNLNLGMLLGAYYQPEVLPAYFNIGWEAHLYLAGSAGLLLTTARKQALAITAGLAL